MTLFQAIGCYWFQLCWMTLLFKKKDCQLFHKKIIWRKPRPNARDLVFIVIFLEVLNNKRPFWDSWTGSLSDSDAWEVGESLLPAHVPCTHTQSTELPPLFANTPSCLQKLQWWMETLLNHPDSSSWNKFKRLFWENIFASPKHSPV